jgi:hypothetical protein
LGRSSALSFSLVLMLLFFFSVFSHNFFSFPPPHLGRSSALSFSSVLMLLLFCLFFLIIFFLFPPLIWGGPLRYPFRRY